MPYNRLKILILLLMFTTSCATIKSDRNESGQLRFRIAGIKLFKAENQVNSDSLQFIYFKN